MWKSDNSKVLFLGQGWSPNPLHTNPQIAGDKFVGDLSVRTNPWNGILSIRTCRRIAKKVINKSWKEPWTNCWWFVIVYLIIGNFMIPLLTWTYIFQRGRYTNHQPEKTIFFMVRLWTRHRFSTSTVSAWVFSSQRMAVSLRTSSQLSRHNFQGSLNYQELGYSLAFIGAIQWFMAPGWTLNEGSSWVFFRRFLSMLGLTISYCPGQALLSGLWIIVELLSSTCYTSVGPEQWDSSPYVNWWYFYVAWPFMFSMLIKPILLHLGWVFGVAVTGTGMPWDAWSLVRCPWLTNTWTSLDGWALPALHQQARTHHFAILYFESSDMLWSTQTDRHRLDTSPTWSLDIYIIIYNIYI